MKEKNAWWEKRNLGLSTLELEIESSDKNHVDDVLNYIQKQEENYDHIVISLPRSSTNLIHNLEDNGYRFIETRIKLVREINKLEICDPYKKFLKKFSYRKVENEQMLNRLISNVDENMFDTGRIHIDPKLGPEISADRYKNWIQDEYNNNASVLYEIIKDNAKPIGFFIYCEHSGNVEVKLGGLYPSYKNLGLGLGLVYVPFVLFDSLGYKTISTEVSSNNLEVLKIYLYFNYKVNDMLYIFRKIK